MDELIDAYLATLGTSENDEVQEYINKSYYLSSDLENLLLLSPVLPSIERDYQGYNGLWRFVWKKEDVLRMIKPSENILTFLHDNKIRFRAKFFGGRILEELLVDSGYNTSALRVPFAETYREGEYKERRKNILQQIKDLQNELNCVENSLKRIKEQELYLSMADYRTTTNITKAARK